MKEDKPTGVCATLDEFKIDQYLRTGHPRLTGLFFGKQPVTMFQNVEIARLTVDGTEAPRRA
jgi:hypothetical protein